MMIHGDLETRARPPHPFVYTILIVPFGATGGFVSVALTYLATKSGLSVAQGATLIAASMFPNVWKFFWAPIADTTLTRKRWYGIASVACALGMLSMAVIPLGPKTLNAMWGVILLTSFAATFLGFAVEALVAHITPADDRGRVSGWFQAGNLGGAGIGGGIGLWLLTHAPATWEAGVVLAVLTLACAIPLAFLPDVKAEPSTGVGDALRNVATDLWSVLRSPAGILCGVLCFVPVGTGAAAGVLTQAEVAAHWGAGETEVTLVQGVLTGVIAMFGCLAGGAVCARMKSRNAYVVFGALMAATTAGMAIAPATPAVYIGFSLVYAFVAGLCYAAFSGFVLDAIGAGNAATKYNGFASLSNTPIWYMGLLLALVETRVGPRGMLFTESAVGVVGIAVFAVAAFALRQRDDRAALAAK
jgi:MFS transporter, PAT family, beta-lactamase induction signal transducer AmpG